MKRPILLAALCWTLVFFVPATRNGLFRAWNTSFSERASGPRDLNDEESFRAARQRFSTDRRVKLDFLVRLSRITSPHNVEDAAREWGEDPVVIALVLQSYLRALKHNRDQGPLSNPNFPAASPIRSHSPSPRAEWDRLIALARRGQKSEPNNTFFDWMALYGLFATHRDAEGRAVLQRAARKTGYDDHLRDLIRNNLAVVRLVYGEPLSPRDYRAAWNSDDGRMFSAIRQAARWIVESAIADRSAGQHKQALDVAFDLTKVGRIMRRQSTFAGINGVGGAVEGFAINRSHQPYFPVFKLKPMAQVPTLPPLFGAPLSQLKASPFTLYSYARSQNRADIMLFLDREWPELGQWRAWELAIFRESWMGNTPRQIALAAGTERWRALILFTLPFALLAGTLSTLLARHFRDISGAQENGFKRGAWTAISLASLALIFDAILAFRQHNFFSDWQWLYLDGPGLLSTLPSWITIAPTLITISLAIGAAISWQKRQVGPNLSFKARLKTLFEAPDDGLMRFDFGWLFGLVTRGTAWILLLGLIVLLCWNASQISPASALLPATPALIGGFLVGIAALIALILHFGVWRTRPNRRATLRLGLRLISQALLGFFVASSVLYALVALGSLPLSFRFERNFQNAMERGETQIARAKLGL